MAKRGLGKGLGALLPQQAGVEKGKTDNEVLNISMERIVPGKHQPRKDFDRKKLEELVQSIKSHGIIQPIVVTPAGDGNYELVAGERRWRAGKIAGMKEIPAIVKQVNEREMAEIALIENLQREDLNLLEEAEAYRKLMEVHCLNQEEIAQKVGKSRPVIANALRILQLPSPIKEMIKKQELSAGHAKAILGLKDQAAMVQLADLIKQKGLTVRQTEVMVQRMTAERRMERKTPDNDANGLEIAETEERLQRLFSTKVKIKRSRNGGRVEIYCFSLEELDRILAVLLKEDVPRGTIIA